MVSKIVLGGINVKRLVNNDGEVGAGDFIIRIYKYCGFWSLIHTDVENMGGNITEALLI
jgi:hypothetical protein